MEVRHEKATIEIKTSRWTATIKITEEDGSVHEYVASADSALADSGLYFATREEYDEDEAEAF